MKTTVENINTKNAQKRLAGCTDVVCVLGRTGRGTVGGVRAAGTRQPLEIIGPRIRDGSGKEGRGKMRRTLNHHVDSVCRKSIIRTGCTKAETYERNTPLSSMSKDCGVSSSLIRVPSYRKLSYPY